MDFKSTGRWRNKESKFRKRAGDRSSGRQLAWDALQEKKKK